MYTILIIEDDPQIAESLGEMLEILGHKVAGIADAYEGVMALMGTMDVDLALVDIQLKGEKTGIDVAEKLRNEFKIPFIFTTAYADKETIQKASEHSPYGYIVKPYGMKDINAGIEIAIANHSNIQNLQEEQGGLFNSESLFVKSNSRIVRIDLSDIFYVEAKGDYTIFKTPAKGYVVNTNFSTVEKKLDDKRFVKVHRSYLVNLEKIVDIEDSSLLIDDKVIPVSRSQKPNLLSRLKMI